MTRYPFQDVSKEHLRPSPTSTHRTNLDLFLFSWAFQKKGYFFLRWIEKEQGEKYILINSPAIKAEDCSWKPTFPSCLHVISQLFGCPWPCLLQFYFTDNSPPPQPPTPQHPAHVWPNRHTKVPDLSSMGAQISSACVHLLPPPPPPPIVHPPPAPWPILENGAHLAP